jgi:hypothetical protein
MCVAECETCKKFLEQKEVILKSSESVFDAALDLHSFVDKCKESCGLEPVSIDSS